MKILDLSNFYRYCHTCVPRSFLKKMISLYGGVMWCVVLLRRTRNMGRFLERNRRD